MTKRLPAGYHGRGSPSREVAVLLAALTLILTTANAETHAAGAVITNAATVDITAEGFDAITGLIPALLPESLDIDPVSGEGGTWCFNYAYALSNAWVGIEVVDAAITPQSGYLDVSMDLMVQINDATDPFQLDIELACIDDTCNGYVAPFEVWVDTTLALEVVTGDDGTPTLEATMGEISVTYDLDAENDIDLGDCGIETLKEILSYLGIDLYGWILGLVEGELDSAIADFGPELEATIEEAFGSASIAEDLDLNGVPLHVELYPADVAIETAGVRLAMNGVLSTPEPAACIAEYDPGGSLATTTDPPSLGTTPPTVDDAWHAGVMVSDDFANQGLYALWEGGLLCYTLSAEDGYPLYTDTVLGLLAGDAFDELFPEPQPIALQTRPRAAPTANYSGEHDVGVDVEDLGMEIYADLDHRMAQIVDLNLGLQLGADLGLDGTTGTLDVALDLGTDAMTCTVSANEFAPDTTAEIEGQCATVLGNLASNLVGGLLPELTFNLPAYGAYGVTELQIAAAGSDLDWLGIFAWIGEVPYGDSSSTDLGCGSEDGGSGCSGGGCEGGTSCAAAGVSSGRQAILALALALVLVRRRR